MRRPNGVPAHHPDLMDGPEHHEGIDEGQIMCRRRFGCGNRRESPQEPGGILLPDKGQRRRILENMTVEMAIWRPGWRTSAGRSLKLSSGDPVDHMGGRRLEPFVNCTNVGEISSAAKVRNVGRNAEAGTGGDAGHRDIAAMIAFQHPGTLRTSILASAD